MWKPGMFTHSIEDHRVMLHCKHIGRNAKISPHTSWEGANIMQLENFEKLEEKIVQAMEIIDRLKQENQEISSSYRKLTEEMRDFETITKGKRAETERYKHELTAKEKDFVKKKEEIKRRVEKLMEKLVSFADSGDSSEK
jgi:FtsZ-binding cell division protein ZapB